MRYSYSRIECWKKCPYQFKLRYLDELETLPDQSPDNALYLGTAIHTAFETGSVEEAIKSYRSNYYAITDAHINEEIKLEYLIPKILELLPDGECEIEIKTDDFVGYIDRLVYLFTDEQGIAHYEIWDYKYSNNREHYLMSDQLHLYKYYFEKTHPKTCVDHLKYVFIPKVSIRQKLKATPPETISEFRNRIMEQLDALEITKEKIIFEIKFDSNRIQEFEDDCKRNGCSVNFYPNPTKLCNWCAYQKYCESNGRIDWMIINNKGEEIMNLPENKRRTNEVPIKRTMWLYGSPFSGKTTFADSAPDPLMLNTDGNAVYVTAPYVSIQDEVTVNGRITQRKAAWTVFKEYLDELEKGQNTFKTIVVDLVNDTYEMCRLYMYDKLGITHESDDSRGAWDKVRTEYLSTMRRVTHLPYENIILLSHEATYELNPNARDKKLGYKPKMQDKVADSLAGMVGIAGRVYVEDEKHLLMIKSDDSVFGGGRLGISNVVIPLDWNEVIKLFENKKESK